METKIERVVDLTACKDGKKHIWRNKTIGYDSDVCLVCGHTKEGIRRLKKIQKQADMFFFPERFGLRRFIRNSQSL